ncbi:HtaA domain-containing protein [Nocardiopsis sp. NRRL B-16309]|uniref:HtaA domain-containing protein n=1 Tax=Nocardiopsis sp. NRRL B-16309 TaxID=1519494 RepID=UPI0006AE4E87|nr:HtaA domain-containing protein [Nocardiopsis sp. NRRL B-16309]KOX13596.1 hypothetical protein ADL05_19000 [Nocardiopsis sp. NRRL B-16309]
MAIATTPSHPTHGRARGALRALTATASAAAVGAVLVLAPSPALADTALSGGSADWGVKESFRNYVSGFIANGDYEATGGASLNNDGTVSFPGDGGVLADDGSVDAAFSGGVVFTGHDYGNGPVLEIQVHNPRVEFDGTEAVIHAEVVSRPFDGVFQTTPNPLVDYGEIPVTELTGESLTVDGGEASFTSTGGVLHEDAVEAFAGFYSAGTAMDPIDFTVSAN